MKNIESTAELNQIADTIVDTIIFPKLWHATEQLFKYRGHEFYAQLEMEHQHDDIWATQLVLSIAYSGIRMEFTLDCEDAILVNPALLQDENVKHKMKTSLDALILQHEAHETYEREKPKPPVIEYKKPAPEEMEAYRIKQLQLAHGVIEKNGSEQDNIGF